MIDIGKDYWVSHECAAAHRKEQTFFSALKRDKYLPLPTYLGTSLMPIFPLFETYSSYTYLPTNLPTYPVTLSQICGAFGEQDPTLLVSCSDAACLLAVSGCLSAFRNAI